MEHYLVIKNNRVNSENIEGQEREASHKSHMVYEFPFYVENVQMGKSIGRQEDLGVARAGRGIGNGRLEMGMTLISLVAGGV